MTSMDATLPFLRMRFAEDRCAESAASRGDGGELDPLVEEIGYHQPQEPRWTLALIVARALASVYADHPDYDPRWAAAL